MKARAPCTVFGMFLGQAGMVAETTPRTVNRPRGEDLVLRQLPAIPGIYCYIKVLCELVGRAYLSVIILGRHPVGPGKDAELTQAPFLESKPYCSPQHANTINNGPLEID